MNNIEALTATIVIVSAVAWLPGIVAAAWNTIPRRTK